MALCCWGFLFVGVCLLFCCFDLVWFWVGFGVGVWFWVVFAVWLICLLCGMLYCLVCYVLLPLLHDCCGLFCLVICFV